MKLINTSRWLRLRRDVLTTHPLCERCESEGYITPATEVHHRKPVECGINYAEKRRLMYDPGNLCALCHSCHVKVHTEMGRSGKAGTRKRNDERLEEIVKRFFDG